MLKTETLIFAENVVFPRGEVRKGPFFVIIKDGLISKICKTDTACSAISPYDRRNAINCHLLAPGFVDIHNQGLGKRLTILCQCQTVVLYNAIY